MNSDVKYRREKNSEKSTIINMFKELKEYIVKELRENILEGSK